MQWGKNCPIRQVLLTYSHIKKKLKKMFFVDGIDYYNLLIKKLIN